MTPITARATTTARHARQRPVHRILGPSKTTLARRHARISGSSGAYSRLVNRNCGRSELDSSFIDVDHLAVE
jgi:hypothetical protein